MGHPAKIIIIIIQLLWSCGDWGGTFTDLREAQIHNVVIKFGKRHFELCHFPVRISINTVGGKSTPAVSISVFKHSALLTTVTCDWNCFGL